MRTTGCMFQALFVIAPLHGFAATIADPTVNGQMVDQCPAINGVTDCRRAMMAATAVCKEYGFRRANSYQLGPISAKAVQLRLSIDGQEAIARSKWKPGELTSVFDAIECSK